MGVIMKFKNCPICGVENIQESVRTEQLRLEGASIEYQSHSCACGACGTEFVTSEQSRLNKRAVVAAKSQYLGLPSREALREWRKKWGLTQKAAGTMLGVGPVAFSKYENATLLPSAPTGRLLDAVMSSDKVVRELAEKHGIAVQLIKDATSRSAVLSIKQVVDSLVTIINAEQPTFSVQITGQSAIEGVFTALSAPKGTSLNIRQTKPEIYHEWIPTLPGQIISSHFTEHGEPNVSYH